MKYWFLVIQMNLDCSCILRGLSIHLSICPSIHLSVLHAAVFIHPSICLLRNIQMHLPFPDYSTLKWYRQLKSFLIEDQAGLIEGHGCWCPDDARIQGISSHGIGLLLPEYSGFSTRRVKIWLTHWPRWWMQSWHRASPLPYHRPRPFDKINTLCNSDAICWNRSGSTLAQVMASLPSGNVDFSLVRFCEGSFTSSASATILYNEFEHLTFEITDTPPSVHWLK